MADPSVKDKKPKKKATPKKRPIGTKLGEAVGLSPESILQRDGLADIANAAKSAAYGMVGTPPIEGVPQRSRLAFPGSLDPGVLAQEGQPDNPISRAVYGVPAALKSSLTDAAYGLAGTPPLVVPPELAPAPAPVAAPLTDAEITEYSRRMGQPLLYPAAMQGPPMAATTPPAAPPIMPPQIPNENLQWREYTPPLREPPLMEPVGNVAGIPQANPPQAIPPQAQAQAAPPYNMAIADLLRSGIATADELMMPGRPEVSSPGSLFGLHPEQARALENEKTRQFEADRAARLARGEVDAGRTRDEAALQMQGRGLDISEGRLDLQQQQLTAQMSEAQQQAEADKWVSIPTGGLYNTETGQTISQQQVDEFEFRPEGAYRIPSTGGDPTLVTPAPDRQYAPQRPQPDYVDLLDGTTAIVDKMTGEVIGQLPEGAELTPRPSGVGAAGSGGLSPSATKSQIDLFISAQGGDPSYEYSPDELATAAQQVLANDPTNASALGILELVGSMPHSDDGYSITDDQLGVGEGGVILVDGIPITGTVYDTPEFIEQAMGILQSKGLIR